MLNLPSIKDKILSQEVKFPKINVTTKTITVNLSLYMRTRETVPLCGLLTYYIESSKCDETVEEVSLTTAIILSITKTPKFNFKCVAVRQLSHQGFGIPHKISGSLHNSLISE